ncbi:MAG: S41 family peptidase [Candidatus Azobacteroides sp.]|nr:S41 family peptidase [Candidatus Azobacteroides sp.]
MKNVVCPFFLSLCLISCSYGQNQNDLSTRKMNMALTAIENLYVDTINQSKLVEDAIVALLEKLDPHSDYMTPEEVKEMNEPLKGNFEGIGIQFNMLTDTLYIVQVIPGSPSEKVGIMAGDRIITVNDSLIAGVSMKTTDIMARLRGPKGSTVNVKIKRGGQSELIPFKIIRDKIPIYSLDASYMIDKETGYIKLNRFSATTYEEFKVALKELQMQGLENLILDLQDNGGGYLTSAIDIANEFLKRGELIVYTEGAHQKRDDAYASTNGSFKKGKVIVLVNESTASASEIVSGALQDWDRAVIVGRRSFGKGLVQRPVFFPDGSMMRLTTARYYTPTGRSIQKPYENGKQDVYNMDLITRYNRGEMLSADSIHFPDSLKYSTLENRRIVYGGGGIMPDYFVPIDTTRFTDIHRSLIASGVINKFVMSYVEKNRSSLQNQYKNFQEYKRDFEVKDFMLKDLLDMFKKEDFEMIRRYSFEELAEDGTTENATDNAPAKKDNQSKRTSATLTADDLKQMEQSKPLIKLQIKALIARDVWNTNEYFQIINDDNEALKKAIDIIENTQIYNKLLGKG